MKFSKHLIAVATAAAILAPATASATNGYFSAAYGPRAGGVAGAATALPQDSMAAAVNPAGMAHVGNRADVNVQLFSPPRRSSVGNGTTDSESNGFIIPSGGYVRDLNDKMTAGITIYANGGMNTNYQPVAGDTNILNGTGRLGVDLAQLIFAPTIAYKLNNSHTVGASLLVGYQQFKAYGLHAFQGFTQTNTLNNLTNQGYDSAWGTGLRVGWQGKLSDTVTVGAAYSTKIYMDEFDKYSELFAEDGDFDIPANWSIGIAAKVSPKLTVTADVQHIQYSDVKSIANDGPSETGSAFSAGQGQLGTDNGLGFGWNDMTILKVGAVYEHNANFTYRFGISHGDQPIDDDQAIFNVLAPAINETHLSAGFTYRPTGKDDNEFTVNVMHAVKNKIHNETGYAFFGGATVESEIYQNSIEAAYSWKF